jgi:hypothetical protein
MTQTTIKKRIAPYDWTPDKKLNISDWEHLNICMDEFFDQLNGIKSRQSKKRHTLLSDSQFLDILKECRSYDDVIWQHHFGMTNKDSDPLANSSPLPDQPYTLIVYAVARPSKDLSGSINIGLIVDVYRGNIGELIEKCGDETPDLLQSRYIGTYTTTKTHNHKRFPVVNGPLATKMPMSTFEMKQSGYDDHYSLFNASNRSLDISAVWVDTQGL